MSSPDGVPTQVETLLEDHVGRTCTGAVALVAREGRDPWTVAVGTVEQGGDAVTADTPFDLASLTKLFTASGALRLVAQRRLTLDDPVQQHLPEFAGKGKDQVTIRHLLTHSSGLPAMIRLYGPEQPSQPWVQILSVDLVDEPGRAVTYSDVGFLILGRVTERLLGASLYWALPQLVLRPLGLHSTTFGPRPEAAATEYDMWRGRRIRGEVHDENAAVLRGVAGHAGLFGTAADLVRLARAYLDPRIGFLEPSLARLATQEQARTGSERRALGWKLRSPSSEAADSVFSESSFGHYGFTGTALWADPARRAIVTLLTNRVYFGRDPLGISELRRQVFRTVCDALPPEEDPEH